MIKEKERLRMQITMVLMMTNSNQAKEEKEQLINLKERMENPKLVKTLIMMASMTTMSSSIIRAQTKV